MLGSLVSQQHTKQSERLTVPRENESIFQKIGNEWMLEYQASFIRQSPAN